MPTVFWILALVCFLLALRLRPRISWPVGIWCGAAFLAANPFLDRDRERGEGLLTNEVLILALYIPVAVLIPGGCWVRAVGGLITPSRQGKAVILGRPCPGARFGTRMQFRIVDPRFQMVTGFRPLRLPLDPTTHIPNNACFLVNGFLPSKVPCGRRVGRRLVVALLHSPGQHDSARALPRGAAGGNVGHSALSPDHHLHQVDHRRPHGLEGNPRPRENHPRIPGREEGKRGL